MKSLRHTSADEAFSVGVKIFDFLFSKFFSPGRYISTQAVAYSMV
jgi:hypothetical protein